jgi:hypothetical protein
MMVMILMVVSSKITFLIIFGLMNYLWKLGLTKRAMMLEKEKEEEMNNNQGWVIYLQLRII